jgi:hypothetical protein
MALLLLELIQVALIKVNWKILVRTGDKKDSQHVVNGLIKAILDF